jgi:hypothetical protein
MNSRADANNNPYYLTTVLQGISIKGVGSE